MYTVRVTDENLKPLVRQFIEWSSAGLAYRFKSRYDSIKKKCITVILCVYRYRIEKFLIQRLIVVRPFVYENIYGTPLYGFFYGTVIKNYYLTTNRSETTRRAILPVILLHSITARRLLYRDIISIYGFIHLWNTCASFRFFFMTLSKTKLPNDGIKARP